ncbi:MAG: flagellar transcriptional regulator FlhD [Nitrosomonas sp.]|nr:flagellar transcriptional regulator FlhD [Nitrosomonas sp.]MDP1949662.1 flagellar transcriptional regulator FlhD [Nitrosomonas sp.]
METNQILDEIREINLGYMLLAQQLVREDKVAAIYRLGISQEIADIIECLSSSQLLRMAASNTLLCRFRFNDHLIAELLISHESDKAVSHSHAAILMAGQPAEVIA